MISALDFLLDPPWEHEDAMVRIALELQHVPVARDGTPERAALDAALASRPENER